MQTQNAEQRQLIGNGGHKDIFAITIDGESKILYRISDKEFYSSIEDIVLKYNVNAANINDNIKNGKSLLEGLNVHIKQPKPTINVGTKKHDFVRGFTHNGVKYESHTEFADVHNLDYKKLMRRLNSGWTYDECISGTRINKKYKKQIHKIHGKIYSTTKSISEEFDIPMSTLAYHLGKGELTAEEIVDSYKHEKPAVVQPLLYNPKHPRTKFEFEGQIYCSEKHLCVVKGINYYTFAKRKERGWTLEECVYGKKSS